LKDLRKEKGMTLKQVSAQLDMPLQTYAAYEHGTREPSIAVIITLCRFYDITSDYLIGLSDY